MRIAVELFIFSVALMSGSQPYKVAIIDYGMGNVNSVYKAIYRLKHTPLVTCDAVEIEKADKLILPGVGHFDKAIENLKKRGLVEALNEAVLAKKKPVLGICLGMQVMATKSEEGVKNGLGWIKAPVERFKIADTVTYKVPHIGWNTISPCKESNLFKGISRDEAFYFLHAYHFDEMCSNTLSITHYEYPFASSIEFENIYGVQFHPEKSHQAGLQLIDNFIRN